MLRGLRKLLHWVVPERIWQKISLRAVLRSLSPRHLWRQMVPEGTSWKSQLRQWYRESGYWYLTSATVHGIGFFILAVISLFLPDNLDDLKTLMRMDDLPPTVHWMRPDSEGNKPERELLHFHVGDPPLDPTKLTLETLQEVRPPAQTAKVYDDSPFFEEEQRPGGMSGKRVGPQLGASLSMSGFAPTVIKGIGAGGRDVLGAGEGTGKSHGRGGDGMGFSHRTGRGRREAIQSGGGTEASERAVGGGLNWLARHQGPAGNWSLQHNRFCKGASCGCPGTFKSDAAATALALLPFLGAGQTHKERGPYRSHVQKGLAWLVKHQKEDGDASCGCSQPMYTQGIVAIALCEAYGMTQDEAIGAAAVKAIRYIEAAQNRSTGGWRYVPGDAGDTSVTGWQIMALKSAQMAGIGVNSMVFDNADKWLKSVATGKSYGLFMYQPYREVSVTMTAVGLLCRQYLGIGRDDPCMVEGREFLLTNLPSTSTSQRNVYYWYYATLVMHNFMGPDWDTWNREMRRALISTQCKEGCAEGSWDPERPTLDAWGSQGGRLMMTSLATLTLEVYYRYMPLFKTNLRQPGEPEGRAAEKMNLVVGMQENSTGNNKK